MNFIKKIAAAVTAAALLCASLPLTVSAQSSKIAYKISYKSKSTSLTLIQSDKDSEIRYTTDGTSPNIDSALYTESINTDRTITVRAAEFDKNGEKISSLKLLLKRKCRKVTLAAEKTDGGFIVALESPTEDCSIYYTTDGSKPTTGSELYKGMFTVKKGTVIRAIAVKKDWKNSAVSKFTVKKSVGTLPEETQLAAESSLEADEIVSSVFEIVNSYRTENGLSPLSLDTVLCEAAAQRASEIAEDYSIVHTRPDGRRWVTVLDEFNFIYCFGAENLAYTQGAKNSAEFVMNSWINSADHRHNILNEYGSLIGIAYVRKGDYIYWVQLFGERM